MLKSRDAHKTAIQILFIASHSGRNLTPMQLIKLSYIAHGWTLGISGEPLFNDTVEAWRYGPVVPDIYHRYKEFGHSPIVGRLKDLRDSFTPYSFAIMERVVEVYGKYDGLYLSALTHKRDSPWDITMREKGENAVIPNDLIEKHYKSFIRQ
ncbi:MAG: DUF4065 domain-containing protein [Bacteroidetes bacterium]|nr:DUF4065 domain-containing protein [Bacteroidota bacterium]